MTVTLEGGCRVSDVREGAPVVEGTLRIWNRIGRATGAQAISLRVMECAPGISPSIRDDECDEVLYMLERRERETATIRIDRHGYDIGSDTGIYIRPNETFAIDNPGPNSVIIISAQCPDPDRLPLFVAPITISSD